MGRLLVAGTRTVIPPAEPPAPPFEETYYVDPANVSGTASDSNNGTSEATAWLTIGKALTSAVSDSLCYVRACTIATTQTYTNKARDGWVTLQPYTAETVTLARVEHVGTTRYVKWEGFNSPSKIGGTFVVDDNVSFIEAIDCSLENGIHVDVGANNLAFTDCDVQKLLNVGSNAINFSGSTTSTHITDVTIQGCEVHNWTNADGIQLKRFKRVVIDDCHIHDAIRTASAHIDMIQALYPSEDLTITNCIIENSDQASFAEAQGIFMSDGVITGELLVENNLLHSLGTVQVELTLGDAGHPDARVIGNTVIGSTVIEGTTNVTAMFNNIMSSLSLEAGSTIESENYNAIVTSTGHVRGANTLTALPTFVNAATGDYRPATGSTALGAGVSTLNSVANANSDIRGETRGDPPVLGCYERAAGDP
jgi:hypothetical protein